MRFETRTERIGENMGPIDWSYNFRKHFDCYCTSDEGRDEICERSKERLRTAEQRLKDGKRTLMTTYGGWPRCGWGDVIEVGMYDGWPYWQPTPSIRISGTLGAEWHSFDSFTDMRVPDEETSHGR